ncbi:MAG: ATP-binding protein [Pseudomonadales bacterium]|nr:ATP-binding protein [Pseudomonadales bacterium]
MTMLADAMASLLSNAIGASYWEWDLASNTSLYEPKVAELFGLSDQNLEHSGPFDIWKKNCHEADVDHVDHAFRRAIEDGTDLDVEFRIIVHSECRYIRCIASHETCAEKDTRKLRGYIYESKTRELQNRVDTLEDVLFHIPGQVFWKDENLNYLGCNNVFSETVGLHHPRDVVGKSDFDFQRSSEHAQMYRDDDKRIMTNGRAELEIDEPYHRSDGSEGHVLTSKVPLKDKNDNVYGILGICSDISDLKDKERALVAQKQSFEELVQVLPVMINSFGENGECNLWNRCCEEVLGYSFKDVQAEPNIMEKFYPDSEVCEKVIQAISNPNGEFHEYPVIVKNGSERVQMWSNFMLSSGMMIGCGVDVTERALLIDELNTANRHKSEFLTNVSHELRTPLNSILGFTKILISQLSEKLNDRHRDALETVHRNGTHLLNVINDILDLSKIEAGKMEVDISDVDLDEVLEAEVGFLRSLAEDKGLRIRSEISSETINIATDKNKLIQVLHNLGSNAIKYTEEGSVTLSANIISDEKLGECVKITLADTGIGIHPKDQKNLFREFVRIAEVREKHIQGTGLGLVISSKMVQVLGGRIELESVHGKGSAFSILLPNLSSESVT